MALSKIPLNFSRKIVWHDYLPVEIGKNGVIENLYRFLASFYHNLLAAKGTFEVKTSLSYTFKGNFLNKPFEGEVKITQNGKFVEEVKLRRENKTVTLKRVS